MGTKHKHYDALSEHYVAGLSNSMKAYKEHFDREVERTKELFAAVPEAEPVGWMDDPVAYIDGPNNMLIWAKPFQYCGPKSIHVDPIPLYLHPPTRIFMRLSDKEIEMVMDNALLQKEIDDYDIFHFARAVEDALDEKNK